jgi:hypothetical protein
MSMLEHTCSIYALPMDKAVHKTARLQQVHSNSRIVFSSATEALNPSTSRTMPLRIFIRLHQEKLKAHRAAMLLPETCEWL